MPVSAGRREKSPLWLTATLPIMARNAEVSDSIDPKPTSVTAHSRQVSRNTRIQLSKAIFRTELFVESAREQRCNQVRQTARILDSRWDRRTIEI